MFRRAQCGMFSIIVCLATSITFGAPQQAKTETTKIPQDKIPQDVDARIKQRETAENDKLLYQLEDDYLKLLQTAKNPASLLKAEEYLKLTGFANWTLHKKASEILLKDREKAAIPLLLRYVVLNSNANGANNLKSIESTLITLAGCKFTFENSGIDLEAKNRKYVAKVVQDWWNSNKEKLDIASSALSTEQLTVVLEEMLEKVGYGESNFQNDGDPLTAYRAHALFSYHMTLKKSSGSPVLTIFDERLISMLLKRFEGRGDFRWEAVWLLGALRSEYGAKELDAISQDESKAPRVRLATIIAMYVAGEGMKTDLLQKLLKTETNKENKLIEIAAIGFGKADVVPDLLRELKSTNIEFATSAMYGLARFTPKEAIPILESRYEEFISDYQLIAMCELLSKYKNHQGRQLMVRILEGALARNDEYCMSRMLSAFATSCEKQDWVHAGANNNNYPIQTRIALKWYADYKKDEVGVQEKLEIAVQSRKRQIEVAQQVKELRQSELKRLLILQGDRVVTNVQSQEAETLFNQATAEVKKHTESLQALESELESLQDH